MEPADDISQMSALPLQRKAKERVAIGDRGTSDVPVERRCARKWAAKWFHGVAMAGAADDDPRH